MPETSQYQEIVDAASRRVQEKGTDASDRLDQLILVVYVGNSRVMELLKNSAPAPEASQPAALERIRTGAKTAVPWGIVGALLTWLAQLAASHVAK